MQFLNIENEVREIIAEQHESVGALSNILEQIQKKYRYLPEEALRIVALELKMPLSRVYGVATFYAAFSLEPKGEHLISVCHGTACHVKGAQALTKSLEEELGIKEGETTKDYSFSLEAVRCLGCCSLAPVISIDGKIYGRLNSEKVSQLLIRWRKEMNTNGEDAALSGKM